MTSRSKNLLRYILSGALTIALLVFAFRNTDLEKLTVSILAADYRWMLLSFLVLVISHAVRGWRWRYLLNPIKPDIGFRNLFSGVMIGYFMNNVLPRAGELVRPYSIGKLESIPKSAALGTIVVERILDTATFLLLVAIIPLVYHGPLQTVFPWLTSAGRIISVVTTGVFAFIIVLMMRRDWTSALLRSATRYFSSARQTKIERLVHSFLDGFLFLKRPGSFIAILFLSAAIWLLYAVMTYLAFFSFGMEGQLGFGAALVLLAISSIGVAIPTPGATGSYHWFAAQTLIGLYGISNEVALGYATVTHAVGFIGITIIGAYYFARDHINIKDAMKQPAETAP
jgi:glycosyltransferase 2 family protein